MIDVAITTTISALITTLILWLVIRSSKKPRKPAKHYLLPWIVGVSGLSVVAYLVFRTDMSILNAALTLGVVGVFVAMLLDAKRLG